MRLAKRLLLASLVCAGMGVATSAEAACVITGKGAVCKGGLSAMAMLVTDKDWERKWNTARDTTPQFHTTSKLGKDESATLLTFFAVDKSGMLELSCDMTIKDSTGDTERYPMQLCFRGNVIAGDIYMTQAALMLTSDGEAGTSEFTVGLRQEGNGTQVKIKTGVTYVP